MHFSAAEHFRLTARGKGIRKRRIYRTPPGKRIAETLSPTGLFRIFQKAGDFHLLQPFRSENGCRSLIHFSNIAFPFHKRNGYGFSSASRMYASARPAECLPALIFSPAEKYLSFPSAVPFPSARSGSERYLPAFRLLSVCKKDLRSPK